MPTYEYSCEACGHEWEETQRITEPPIEVCPACSKPSAHRLISAGTNFILKGGGWYSDLYTSPKPAAGGQTKPDGKAEPKSETKTDSSSDKSDKSDKAAPKAASTSTTTSSTTTPSTT